MPLCPTAGFWPTSSDSSANCSPATLPEAEKLVLTMLSTESDPPGSVLPIVRVEDDNVVFGQVMVQPRFENVLLLESPKRIGAACAGKAATLAAQTNALKTR